MDQSVPRKTVLYIGFRLIIQIQQFLLHWFFHLIFHISFSGVEELLRVQFICLLSNKERLPENTSNLPYRSFHNHHFSLSPWDMMRSFRLIAVYKG